MCRTTVLIFGSNGMLGTYIAEYLKQMPTYHVVELNRHHYNVMTDSYDKLFNLIDKQCDIAHLNCSFPTQITLCNCKLFVINCIGLIPQACYYNSISHSINSINPINSINKDQQYYKINTVFPHVLAGICSHMGIKLIHASTDCVFSGKEGNYNEKHIADENKVYGLSKRLGEPENCCVIRTSIIGEQINHKYSLLEFVKSKNGQSIQGYSDHFWNGITCLQFAKSLDKIIRKNLYWIGIKHIFSPDIISKYDLVKLIANIWGIDVFIEPVANGHCDKTLTTIYGLCNELQIPSISKQLNELKQFNILN